MKNMIFINILLASILAINALAMENPKAEQTEKTKILLQSFAAHGIIPAAYVQEKTGLVPMNSADNAQHEGVFTSSVCLEKLSDQEKAIVIDELLHHNFLGMFNMGIERRYVKKYDQIADLKIDIEDRLAQTMVFIVEPDFVDVNFSFNNKNLCYNLKTMIEQANNITAGSTTKQGIKFSVFSENYGARGTKGILQVTYPDGFTWDKIKAVIVPSPLKKLVEIAFKNKNIAIIEAPLKKGILKLSDFTRDVSIDSLALDDYGLIKDILLPDYKVGLDNMLKELKLLNFATHITRLTAQGDLEIKFETNNKQIIEDNRKAGMNRRVNTLNSDSRTVFFPSDSCHNCMNKGELQNCPLCKEIQYCGKDCQKADRAEHKKYWCVKK